MVESNKNSKIPSYTFNALKGLSFLFRPYNDIDIYIEDTTCLRMYEILVNRFLKGKAVVKRIFPLGGREQVLLACKNDQNERGRRRLYIIDGDFDSLLNNKISPHLRRLYQLRVYCSENLIFCSYAIHEIASECLTNKMQHEVKNEIQFDIFLSNLIKNLTPLFMIYGAAYILDSSIKTTGYSINMLLEHSGKFPTISQSKIQARIKLILHTLLQDHTIEEIRDSIKLVKKNIPSDIEKVARILSGKTYLLPMLNFHLREKAHFSGTLDQLKVRLAKYCKCNIDPGLVSALQRSSRGL